MRPVLLQLLASRSGLRTLVLASALASATAAHAGPVFRSNYSGIFLPKPVGAPALGDVTGDGIPDVVVTVDSDSSVYVIPGVGDGTLLTVPTQLSASGLAGPVLLGDVDGDGRPDIVVSCGGGITPRLSVFRSLGSGAFAPRQDVPIAGFFNTNVQPAAADLDGDGRADIVGASTTGISVLLARSGGFAPETTYPVSGVSDLAIGDLNGDGNPDVVVGTTGGPGPVRVLRGSASGALSPPKNFTPYENGGGVYVAVADFNGDGKPDVMTDIYLFPGLATDTLGTPTGIPGNGLKQVAADVNGDGHLDAVGFERNTGALQYSAGDGAGHFATFENLYCGSSSRAMSAADMNHDGLTDVVVTAGKEIRVLLQKPGGGLGYPNSPVPGFPGWIAGADFDGDGHVDVALTGGSASAVTLMRGLSDGGFVPIGTLATSASPQAIAAGDLDGDGRADLAVIEANDQVLHTFHGLGDGTFFSSQRLVTAGGPSAIALADVNGDGRMDVVVANKSSNTISVFLRMVGGTLGTKRDFPVGIAPIALLVQDVTLDGIPDVLAALSGSGTVAVLRGFGDGSFGNPMEYGTGSPHAIALDSSRPSNLYVGVPGALVVLPGSTTNLFDPRMLYDTYGTPIAIAVADFDGDAVTDAVVEMGETVLLRGDGLGGLGAPIPFAFSGPMFVDDVDHDGNPDLVLLENSNGATMNTSNPYALRVLFNQSHKTVAAVPAAPSGSFLSIGRLAFAGDELQVTIAAPGRESPRVVLLDVMGRRVAERNARAGSEPHRVSLASAGLPAGVYFATLTQGAQRVSRKAVLTR